MLDTSSQLLTLGNMYKSAADADIHNHLYYGHSRCSDILLIPVYVMSTAN